MSTDSITIPSVSAPSIQPQTLTSSPLPSPDLSCHSSEDDSSKLRPSSRPKLGSRKSSGTMIVSRDQPTEVQDDDFEDTDVRAMSPRRSSAELDKLGEEARRDLIEQAMTLQTSLQAIVERVDAVKNEHDKLEGGNKFLQSYIGELMQTSKITHAGAAKSKGKGRLGK